MQPIEYQNTITAVQVLTNLFDIILYKENYDHIQTGGLKEITESKLKELVSKL